MSLLISSIYSIIILVLGLAGFAWLSVKKFEWAIYLAIFLLPLYLLKIKLFFVPLSVLEILIWFLFVVWLLQRRYKNIKLEQIKDIVLPSLLLLIGIIASVLLSANLKVSAGILKGWFVAPMIFALMVVSEIKTKEKVKKTLWSLVISASAVSLVAILYYLEGKLTFDSRLAAFFLSPNHLAMYLSSGFLVAVAFFSQAAKAGEKTLLIATLTVSGLSLYLTLSYTAWLSIFAMIIFLLAVSFKFGRDKNKNFLAPRLHSGQVFYFLFFIFLLVGLVFSQLGSQKLASLLDSNRSSWQSRLMIWQAAWKIIKDYPIFGIGPGMFQEYYLKYQSHFALPYLEWAVPQPHNLFLAFWLQSGLLGLSGFVWLLIVFFRKVFKEIKNKNQLALILFMLTGYTVLHGLADTTYWKNDLAVMFWVVIALCTALANIEEPKSQEQLGSN